MGRAVGLPGAARQAAVAVSKISIQKTAGFAMKKKERDRVAEKSGVWLNIHRHVRVTLISTSLR